MKMFFVLKSEALPSKRKACHCSVLIKQLVNNKEKMRQKRYYVSGIKAYKEKYRNWKEILKNFTQKMNLVFIFKY